MSQEVAPAVVLATAVLLLSAFGPAAARGFAGRLAALLAQAHTLTPRAGLRLAGVAFGLCTMPFLLASMLTGAASVLVQTGALVHLGALRPDLSRLDPLAGLAKLVSRTALLEVGKSVVKLAVVAVAAYSVLAAALPLLPATLAASPAQLLGLASSQVLRVLIAVLLAQVAIAVLDVVRTRVSHAGGLRMTRQEVRDEHKDSEGNPQIKARIRRLRIQRARRRMMAAVPKATVVVTNPTHYAVALYYKKGSAAAPRVIAKGMDEVATRIRELAREHRVPLVANPPLARALHALELDAEVPREMFQAVAELIAYVWRLRGRATL
jgi:flagellar biosynthetic protein FlhB